MAELARLPPGVVLDAGAYYGLVSGAAYRMGWKVEALDYVPVPNFSGLCAPERGIDIKICNLCTDALPYADNSLDAIFFLETLEHLHHSIVPILEGFFRCLRPGGRLILSTPNPAALSKLVRLVQGVNNEPFLDVFLKDDAYVEGGKVFYQSNRESRVWTWKEVESVLEKVGFQVASSYFYANTVNTEAALKPRARAALLRWANPLVRRVPLLGGGTFVIGEKPF